MELRSAPSRSGAFDLLKAREASLQTPRHSLVAQALRCNPNSSLSQIGAKKPEPNAPDSVEATQLSNCNLT